MASGEYRNIFKLMNETLPSYRLVSDNGCVSLNIEEFQQNKTLMGS